MIAGFILIGFTLVSIASAIPSGTSGTCVSLGSGYNQTQQWTSFCYDAVKYDYFLPTGLTEADMNAEVLRRISNTSDPWSGSCKAAIKKFTCASVYLKCVPGVDMGNTATWNNGVYGGSTYPLPYLIPCVSQCTLVRSECYDMPAYYGIDYGCAPTHDYGAGAVSRYYQSADDSAVCFTISTTVLVAENKEYYRGAVGGVCSGYVNPNNPYIYVPPSNLKGIDLAPYLAPNVTQTYLESSLAAAFALMPPAVTADCHVALKKHFCGTFFVAPVEKSMTDLLWENGKGGNVAGLNFVLTGLQSTSYPYISPSYWMNSNFTIPRFPSYEVCTNYSSKCASLISFGAKNGLTDLVPDCEGRNHDVTTKFRYYPEDNQAVASLTLVAPINTILVNSTPNTMSYVDEAAVKANYKPVAVGANSAGQCKTLNITDPLEQLEYFCYGVVDYYYLLPAGFTDAMLNELVMEQVSTSFALLPNTCQQNLKRLLCSAAYLRCPSAMNITDPLTWNPNVYSGVAIPMMRPCLNQCLLAAASCLGIPDMFGLPINCSATFDYTGGLELDPMPLMYDSSNDATCNLITTSVTVQEGAEPYLGSICKGYTHSLFVPPSDTDPLPFAPMAPPYVVQNYIEAGLHESALPLWMEKTCHDSMQRFVCGTYYLKPEAKTITGLLTENGIPGFLQDLVKAEVDATGLNGTALMHHLFYMPSYPSYEICNDYQTKCADFIALVADIFPTVVPNCNGFGPNSSVRLYPSSPTQTITVVEVPMLGTNLSFNTSTNMMSDTNYTAVGNFSTTCPTGFSPTDREQVDDRSVVIQGTGCTADCITALWTPREWNYYFATMQVFIAIGFVMNIITVLIHGKYRDTNDEALLLTFMGLSLLNGMWSLVMLNQPVEARYCSTKFSYINDSDGLTLCAVQSVISLYSILGMGMLIMFEAVNWYQLKVLGTPIIPIKHKIRQILAALTFPLISVLVMLGGGLYGYRRNGFSCFFSSDEDKIGPLDSVFFYIPQFIFMLVALFCMFRVMLRACIGGKHSFEAVMDTNEVYEAPGTEGANSSATSSNNLDNSDQPPENPTVETASSDDDVDRNPTCCSRKNDMHVVSLHFALAMFFGIFWMISSILRFMGSKSTDRIEELFFEWAGCIFTNFSSDGSHYDICGAHSRGRPSGSIVLMMLLVVHAHGFWASLIILPATWRTFYHCVIKGEKLLIETSTATRNAKDADGNSGKMINASMVAPLKVAVVTSGDNAKNSESYEVTPLKEGGNLTVGSEMEMTKPPKDVNV